MSWQCIFAVDGDIRKAVNFPPRSPLNTKSHSRVCPSRIYFTWVTLSLRILALRNSIKIPRDVLILEFWIVYISLSKKFENSYFYLKLMILFF